MECLNRAWQDARDFMSMWMRPHYLRDICDSSWDEDWNSAFIGKALFNARLDPASLCAGLTENEIVEVAIATGSWVLADCPGLGTITVADLGRNPPPASVTMRTCAKFGDPRVKDQLLRKYMLHPGRRWGPYQWWFYP